MKRVDPRHQAALQNEVLTRQAATSLRTFVEWAWPILEHKYYFDEAYDLLFYRPAAAFAGALQRFVERPLIAGSIGEVTRSFGFGSRELGRVQNGLVRSYALALASGIAILAVVFLSAR